MAIGVGPEVPADAPDRILCHRLGDLGVSTGATHTFRTPFTGARNAICRPSGLTRRAALSGIPETGFGEE